MPSSDGDETHDSPLSLAASQGCEESPAIRGFSTSSQQQHAGGCQDCIQRSKEAAFWKEKYEGLLYWYKEAEKKAAECGTELSRLKQDSNRLFQQACQAHESLLVVRRRNELQSRELFAQAEVVASAKAALLAHLRKRALLELQLENLLVLFEEQMRSMQRDARKALEVSLARWSARAILRAAASDWSIMPQSMRPLATAIGVTLCSSPAGKREEPRATRKVTSPKVGVLEALLAKVDDNTTSSRKEGEEATASPLMSAATVNFPSLAEASPGASSSSSPPPPSSAASHPAGRADGVTTAASTPVITADTPSSLEAAATAAAAAAAHACRQPPGPAPLDEEHQLSSILLGPTTQLVTWETRIRSELQRRRLDYSRSPFGRGSHWTESANAHKKKGNGRGSRRADEDAGLATVPLPHGSKPRGLSETPSSRGGAPATGGRECHPTRERHTARHLSRTRPKRDASKIPVSACQRRQATETANGNSAPRGRRNNAAPEDSPQQEEAAQAKQSHTSPPQSETPPTVGAAAAAGSGGGGSYPSARPAASNEHAGGSTALPAGATLPTASAAVAAATILSAAGYQRANRPPYIPGSFRPLTFGGGGGSAAGATTTTSNSPQFLTALLPSTEFGRSTDFSRSWLAGAAAGGTHQGAGNAGPSSLTPTSTAATLQGGTPPGGRDAMGATRVSSDCGARSLARKESIAAAFDGRGGEVGGARGSPSNSCCQTPSAAVQDAPGATTAVENKGAVPAAAASVGGTSAHGSADFWNNDTAGRRSKRSNNNNNNNNNTNNNSHGNVAATANHVGQFAAGGCLSIHGSGSNRQQQQQQQPPQQQQQHLGPPSLASYAGTVDAGGFDGSRLVTAHSLHHHQKKPPNGIHRHLTCPVNAEAPEHAEFIHRRSLRVLAVNNGYSTRAPHPPMLQHHQSQPLLLPSQSPPQPPHQPSIQPSPQQIPGSPAAARRLFAIQPQPPRYLGRTGL